MEWLRARIRAICGRFEAEENLLLDMQFLLQEMLTDRQISRVDLAKMMGISKSRLSQIMGSEANPTLKTCVRLFDALGESISLSLKKKAVEPMWNVTRFAPIEDES